MQSFRTGFFHEAGSSHVEDDLEIRTHCRGRGHGHLFLDAVLCGEEEGGGACDLRCLAIQDSDVQQSRLVHDAKMWPGRQMVSVSDGMLAAGLPEITA